MGYADHVVDLPFLWEIQAVGQAPDFFEDAERSDGLLAGLPVFDAWQRISFGESEVDIDARLQVGFLVTPVMKVLGLHGSERNGVLCVDATRGPLIYSVT